MAREPALETVPLSRVQLNREIIQETVPLAGRRVMSLFERFCVRRNGEQTTTTSSSM